MNHSNIHILSLDAKDIFLSNYESEENEGQPVGYRITYPYGARQGEINTKKFTNTLDSSLDLLKIREIYQKVYRNTRFSFEENGQEYTTHIINVTFQYSNKEFNQLRKGIYVKFGSHIQNLDFQDHICVVDGILIAIETGQDVEQPVSQEMLGPWFYLENGQYRAKSNISTLQTVSQLRHLLYQNGFYCNGIKYVRYKRSGGSARVGKCLFIDEKLYKRLMKWSLCGLKIKEGASVDLAGLEAYLALPLSSITDTLQLDPENFLIVDDYESVFQENVVETRLGDDHRLITDEQLVTIRNSIWDGQSLLDTSLFENYWDKGMLLLRNQFFKSACFHCKLQDWFADHHITEVSQLNGFTIARSIRDIKIITTPSSIKYLKFGTAQQWFDHMSPLFGIVKHEKPTPFFQGRMVQTHYQLLNTLQLSQWEIREFLKPSLSYLDYLKTDPAVLRYHIQYPKDQKLQATKVNSKQDVVFRLLGINEQFAKTKLYQDFKQDLTKSYVKHLRYGHILVNGTYATLLGNPIEMLLQAIGRFDGTSQMGKGNMHCKGFSPNQTLLGCRSPHVTIGNLWLPVNTHNAQVDRYFSLSREIAAINSIGESVLDRLSGCDFDSDTVLFTNNSILIQAAKKHYSRFLVPVNHVFATKRTRTYTRAEQADLDLKTSDNKIGDIINLSQELNSLLWDRMNQGAGYEDIKELYYDICQLDILSGIEIDKAKKEYTTNTYQEMKRIKERWITRGDDGRVIKPDFFSHLAKAKGYYDPSKKKYLRHHTSMDYLQKVINQFQAGYRGKNKGCVTLSFSSILNQKDYQPQAVYYEQVNRVLLRIREYMGERTALYTDETLDSSTRYHLASSLKEECFSYIGNLKFHPSTMIYLLRLMDEDTYRPIARILMSILFGYPNTAFYDVLRFSKEHIPILMEAEEGDLLLYDFRFKEFPVG